MSLLSNNRNLALLPLLLLLVVGCQMAYHHEDITKSFRGVDWGDEIAHHSELQIKNKRETVERPLVVPPPIIASKADEVLTMGEAKLDSVDYIFSNKGFIKAVVQARGVENFYSMNKYLQNLYGKPKTYNEAIKISSWDVDNISLLLRYYRMPNEVQLEITKRGP